MTEIVDSYSETNQSGSQIFNDNPYKGAGQSFTGDGGTLNSVKFYLKKTGNPTGNATINIYAHDGTYGESSIPTGDPLATAESYDVSNLTTSYQLITFTFSGDDKITLNDGTYYVVTFEHIGDESNAVIMGDDASSPTHDGNNCYKWLLWAAANARDTCFYVYKDSDEEQTIGPFPTYFNI